MEVILHDSAGSFLNIVRPMLEAEEAAYSLMYGLALRLQREPTYYGSLPLLATVHDEEGLALAAVMTPPHRLLVGSERSTVKAPAKALLRRIIDDGWQVPGVLGPAPIIADVVVAWQAVTGGQAEVAMRQRVFELFKVIPPPPAPGRLRPASPADVNLVARWVLAFQDEALAETTTLEKAHKYARDRIAEGSLFVWAVGGHPVSMAVSTRPTPNGISIGMVYTPPEQRRRGYASNCVARLSQHLLDAGYGFCALFTDLANPTSNRIYQALGYRAVCDFDAYRLE
ncbi:MAG TPA: GNAT family N-acetyltransferase [Anaerolineae bacterium]